jgi:hypothetical protein
MDAITEALSRAVAELLGRASGPFHLRLVIQPTVAAVLAIRAGLKDAREGRPPFLWTVATDPDARRHLLQSGWKDIAKVFTLALVLDTVYQLVALHGLRIVQTLLVAVVVAMLPYALLRGPVNRLARRKVAR